MIRGTVDLITVDSQKSSEMAVLSVIFARSKYHAPNLLQIMASHPQDPHLYGDRQRKSRHMR